MTPNSDLPVYLKVFDKIYHKGHHLDALGLSAVASALTYESVLFAEHLQGEKK